MTSSWRITATTAFVVSSPERVVTLNLMQLDEPPRALLGSGAAIWQHLVAKDHTQRPWISETTLLSGLADQHGVAQEQIAPDVLSFLAELQDEGLVERSIESPDTVER